MTQVRKTSVALVAALLVALVVAFGSAPQFAQGADHLDAPGLNSPGGDARLDINDLYVFEGSNASNTVLAVTVSPLAAGDSTFIDKQDGSYHLRVDTNGDAREDIMYTVEFNTQDDGRQKIQVREVTGRKAGSTGKRGGVIGEGFVGESFALDGGGTAWAGLRSDPFFFDLSGFLGTVEGIGTDGLGVTPSDFFTGLNTLAIVIEVPDSRLGTNIGVWATTTSVRRGSATQIDRIGRPAINTVVNSSGPIVGAPSAAKNIFNASHPKNDVANFTDAVVNALVAFSSLDPVNVTPYTDAEARGLAAVLLPDVITYNTGTLAVGPLNGRALADDVIDVELSIVTKGIVTSDGVGPHADYSPTFPYLGQPNS